MSTDAHIYAHHLTPGNLLVKFNILKGIIPYRIGIGFDSHCLKKGRRLILGGIEIKFHLGLSGHSDADVLLHALIDALTGALGMPDIGTLFPDNDPKYQNASSEKLLKIVLDKVKQKRWQVAQIDTVIICDQPKLTDHFPSVRNHLSKKLNIPSDRIGLKAKTTEGTRIALPEKSISALVTALLVPQR
ncbi:MAG: 2-C-methyl-D-erythritol 2,4-cyclodiphosphate synthase [candidate division WOR-3 bacterium]